MSSEKRGLSGHVLYVPSLHPQTPPHPPSHLTLPPLTSHPQPHRLTPPINGGRTTLRAETVHHAVHIHLPPIPGRETRWGDEPSLSRSPRRCRPARLHLAQRSEVPRGFVDGHVCDGELGGGGGVGTWHRGGVGFVAGDGEDGGLGVGVGGDPFCVCGGWLVGVCLWGKGGLPGATGLTDEACCGGGGGKEAGDGAGCGEGGKEEGGGFHCCGCCCWVGKGEVVAVMSRWGLKMGILGVRQFGLPTAGLRHRMSLELKTFTRWGRWGITSRGVSSNMNVVVVDLPGRQTCTPQVRESGQGGGSTIVPRLKEDEASRDEQFRSCDVGQDGQRVPMMVKSTLCRPVPPAKPP